MEDERYAGEHRVLRAFLTELRPVADQALGRYSMVGFAIWRALASNALADLRHARRLFNQLPRSLKQVLSDGLVERARRHHPAAAGRPLVDRKLRVAESLTDGTIEVHVLRPDIGSHGR